MPRRSTRCTKQSFVSTTAVTGAALDGTLEAAPVLLARDAPTVAATIHGHLEGSEPPWGQAGLDLRSTATELVAAIPDSDAHRAHGAAMDRHEIVALTLAALDGK